MSDPTESIRRERLAEINAVQAAEKPWNPSMGMCGTRRSLPRTSR